MADSSRLDAALTTRGLARSRTVASALISGGKVKVNGRTAVKASLKVDETTEITVEGADHYVSRGAHKLLAALDAFGIDPSGQVCLDVGASTGGFTQVLLERGADTVVALDVGHDQLADQIREDPRVVVVEGFNARDLTPSTLANVSRTPTPPTLVVGDLSFISLTMVLEPLVRTCDPNADLVLLIKPQFEVGKSGIKEGIVRDPALRVEAIETVMWCAWDLGWSIEGLIPSPIIGAHGNNEYLVRLTRQINKVDPTEWLKRITEMAGA